MTQRVENNRELHKLLLVVLSIIKMTLWKKKEYVMQTLHS